MNRRLFILAFLAGMIGGIFGPMLIGWTYTYDTATPADSDAPTEGDDRIREVKAALQERLAIDHVFSLTGTEVSDANAGKHQQVTFYNASNSHDGPNLTILSASGVYELYYNDPCGNAVQLTTGGYPYIPNAYVDSNMIIDVNTADITDGTILATDLDSDANDFCDDSTIEIDGTVGLRVKDDGITLAKLASDAQCDPATYAAEESIAFPNGLTLKIGYIASAGGTTTVTFDSAFSTAIVSVQVTVKDTNSHYESAVITAASKTAITIDDDGKYDGFYWQAWGY